MGGQHTRQSSIYSITVGADVYCNTVTHCYPALSWQTAVTGTGAIIRSLEKRGKNIGKMRRDFQQNATKIYI